MFTTQNKSHFNLKLQGIELPGTHKPGQTGIWRNVANIDELSLFPSPDVTTLYEVFENCCLKQSAKQPYLGHRPYDPVTETYGDYTWQTYEKIAERRTNFGSGLLHLNEQVIKRNETERWTVGVIANNRPEWMITDQACVAYNLISVALYETLGPDTIEFVTNHAELRLIIASSEQIPKILGMANKLTNLNVIISMDPLSSGKKPAIGRLATDQALKGWANEKGIVLLEFEEVENLGKEHPKPHKPPKPDDVFTISYTSGTTGDPKGAMISHKNMVVAASAGKSTWPFYNTDITISYLPLAHLYGRIVDWITTLYAARIGYYRGDVLLLVDDVGVLRPTIFPTVPRLLNKIYARLKAATLDAPGVVGHLARAGYAAKLTNLIAGRGAAHLVWDRLIFNKVTQVLGGNLRTLFTASAPISPEVLQFLRVVFSIEICEGYSLTEGVASTTIVLPGDTKPGHVGPPQPCAELKLVDVPEMNYYSTDKPFPRGEICQRGGSVFLGYYKDEKKTREIIDEEGWLHTGDIGFFDERGTLTIIDRIKNIFKLAQGEYIAPEKIENTYTESNLLLQIFVHGKSIENYLIAIVIPDPVIFVPWANVITGQNVDPADVAGFTELCADPKLRDALLSEMTKIGKIRKLRGFEFVKNIYIEAVPFSVENNLLTPTFKIKRIDAVKKYQAVIDKLYAEGPLNPQATKSDSASARL